MATAKPLKIYDGELQQRLKALVNDHSQAEIARKTGTSPVNVNHYLRGTRIPASFCAALSDGLGVNPAWLLTGEGGKSSTEIAQLKPTTKGVIELVNVLKAMQSIRFGKLGTSSSFKSLRELNNAMQEYGELRRRIEKSMAPVLDAICNDLKAALERRELAAASELYKAGSQLAEICADSSVTNQLFLYGGWLHWLHQDVNKALELYSTAYWRSLTDGEMTASARLALTLEYVLLLFSTGRMKLCRRISRSVIELVEEKDGSVDYHFMRFCASNADIHLGRMKEELGNLIASYRRLPKDMRTHHEPSFKEAMVLAGVLPLEDILSLSDRKRRSKAVGVELDAIWDLFGSLPNTADLELAHKHINARRKREDLSMLNSGEAYIVTLHKIRNEKDRDAWDRYHKLPSVDSALKSINPKISFREITRCSQLARLASKRTLAKKLLIQAQEFLDQHEEELTMRLPLQMRHYLNIQETLRRTKASKDLANAVKWSKRFESTYKRRGYELIDNLIEAYSHEKDSAATRQES